jgi:tetratricopeptide (TPR) repeat protein
MVWSKIIVALAVVVPLSVAHAQPNLNSLIDGVSVITIATDLDAEETEQGSGVIVDKARRLVLCTLHQVKGLSNIKVITETPRLKYDAKIVASDATHDLALLKLALLKTGAPLPRAAVIGDADTLSKLDDIVAITTPVGIEFQYTKGHVSGVDKRFNGQPVFTVKMSGKAGSSGGPIFSTFGKVVGITSRSFDELQDTFIVTRINSAYPMLRDAGVWIPLDEPSNQQIIPSRGATTDETAGIAHWNRGLLAESNAEKVKEYGLAVYRVPKFFEAWFNYGIALAKSELHEQAEAAYEIAQQLRPKSGAVYRNLGLLYLEPPFNDNKSAQEMFEMLATYRRLDPSSHNFLGESLRRQGKFAAAVESFEKALLYDPKYDKAHFNLAWTYLNMPDRLKDARKHMDLYQELSPNTTERNDFESEFQNISK